MKDHGLAHDARDAFMKYVVNPFEEHFGPGGSTFSKPMFKPIMTLLDLQGNEGKEIEKIDDYIEWASVESKMPIQSTSLEKGLAAFAASPSVIFGEIYFYLSKRVQDIGERKRFIKIGIRLMERTLESTKLLPFCFMYSKIKLKEMRALASENDCLD